MLNWRFGTKTGLLARSFLGPDLDMRPTPKSEALVK